MDASEQAFDEGLAYLGQGELDVAFECFCRVDDANVEVKAKALAYRGHVLTRKGRFAEAVDCLQQSLALRMRKPQAWYFLGECYFYQRNWLEAEKNLRECLAIEPKFTDAYIRLGIVLKEQQRIDEAMRSFELAIVNDQKAVVARYELARICVDRQDYKRALSQLYFVKDLASSYAPAFALQGDIHQRIGDHRQAIVEYVKVVEIGQADASLY
ncbi:MAG: tetratricopeptide repeat protein, partial [Cyanobacteria bacterium REEB65]|nr:tetratricopeptide repeat protein [Cyanobacteria bacterium REEB65]